MQCAMHPDVETELACSRCGKAICPRCLVHTPVGARCRECANVRRLPMYNLSTATYARGASASLIAGIVAGLVWYFFFKYTTFSGGFIAAAVIGLGIGYVVGEAVAIATNRRRGLPLQILAAAGVVLAYAIRVTLLLASDEWTVETLFAFREFEVLAVLATGIGAWFAAQRVR
jgi:tetrahydromethanopterin S-methyltransferase subunit C